MPSLRCSVVLTRIGPSCPVAVHNARMTNGGATRARDHVVDIVRLAAMIIVVCMHWCYLHLWMEDGLQLELALSGPVVWALT